MSERYLNTLIVYDVGSKRVAKVHKQLIGSLFWEQMSVFSGNLSRKQFLRVVFNIERIIDCHEDSVYAFYLRYPYKLKVLRWGKRASSNELLLRR